MSIDLRQTTDVHRLIADANAARLGRGDERRATDAERQLEALFHTSETLAVYGTLAPGRPNHHVVAPLGGEWTQGVIEGDLIASGWGATFGFPAFRPRAGGAAISVHVLRAPTLPAAWPRLDRFEGAEYRRILVPVFRSAEGEERQLQAVANLYAAAQPFA